MGISILLNLHWELDQPKYHIDDNILFQKADNSPVYKLYNNYCNKIGTEDYAKPNGTHILIDDELLDNTTFSWHTPTSIISEILNILTFCYRLPIPSYYLIFTRDDFSRIIGTPFILNDNYLLLETLVITNDFTDKINNKLNSIDRNFKESYILDKELIDDFEECYNNLSLMRNNQVLRNAFDFFFNAWYSHQFEHICINLAIVLESLFSPTDNHELTHRIAFNVSHFLDDSYKRREKIYKIIRDFYNIRSRIVHGGTAKLNTKAILASTIFILCCDILKKLFMDVETAHQFSNNRDRSALFKKYMFN